MFIILLLVCMTTVHAQKAITWSPFLQQTGMYYSSDRVTSDGFGLGVGVHLLHKSQVAAQADLNLIWGNGNAVTSRFAAGYQRKGTWAPAVYATINLLWGNKTEILSETGQRPPSPVWVIGLRIVPLRFETKNGYVSALEFGYGFGPDKAKSLEISILSIGLKIE